MELKKPSLKKLVYETLKQRILNQQYKFGERLNIDSLVSELKVSNSPIREAIMLLERDGLAEVTTNNGARVISFTEERYSEVCNTICVLLLGSYEFCLENGSIDQILALMDKNLSIQREMYEKKKYKELVKHSVLFDKSLIIGADIEHLLHLYEQLEAIFYLMILYNIQLDDENCLRNIEEHQKIMDAVASGNSDDVKKWIKIHYNKHV